jgi:hypothetical protein
VGGLKQKKRGGGRDATVRFPADWIKSKEGKESRISRSQSRGLRNPVGEEKKKKKIGKTRLFRKPGETGRHLTGLVLPVAIFPPILLLFFFFFFFFFFHARKRRNVQGGKEKKRIPSAGSNTQR